MTNTTTLGRDLRTGEAVGIPQDDRTQGLYVFGVNGTGKTTLLVNLIIQDIKAGCGLSFFDSHGDAIKDILTRIPPDREKDIILLNPLHTAMPFGLNPFSCDDRSSDEKVALTSGLVMHVFEKIFGVGPETPRLADVLRNVTITLIENNLTMAEIPMLLLDTSFRSRVVRNVSNENVKLWWQVYNNLRPTEQIEWVSSTLNKVNAFITNPLIARIISQTKSTIDMTRVMDENKILLVELDPRLEDISTLIGTTIIAKILEAAYSRRDTPSQDRELFALYLDEAHRYETEDLTTLLAEARKYGIATTLAHQFRGQISERMKGATLNVSNYIIFRIASEDVEVAGIFDTTPQVEVVSREEILVPRKSVLTHLLISGHQSSIVMEFTEKYIVPLNLATKEEVVEHEYSDGWGDHRMEIYPSSPVDIFYRFDPKDIEKGLVYLNEFLYLSMTHNHTEAKKAFYQAGLKFGHYLGCYRYFAGPARQTLKEDAQKKIAKLNQEISEKRAVLESNEAFLGLFVTSSVSSGSGRQYLPFEWQKEQTIDRKRQGVLEFLGESLMYGHGANYAKKHPINTTALVGASVEEVRARLKTIAEVNAQLCALDTPEKLRAIRRYYVGVYLAQLEQKRSEMMGRFCRMIGWRGSACPIQYEDGKPGLHVNNCYELCKHLKIERRNLWLNIVPSDERRNAENLCLDIARLDEAIYDLKKDPLQARLMRGRPFEPASLEAIAGFCKFLSTLDTPEKVIECHKQAYIEFEINPLLEKIKVISGQLENSLHDLDGEKPRIEAFYNAAMSAALELEANPIMEGSGGYRDITRQVQTHADRQAGIGNALTQLARFRAWAKLGNRECVFQTDPLPPRNNVVLSEVIADIRRRNIEQGYTRPVSEVKEELRARQNGHMPQLTSKQRI